LEAALVHRLSALTPRPCSGRGLSLSPQCGPAFGKFRRSSSAAGRPLRRPWRPASPASASRYARPPRPRAIGRVSRLGRQADVTGEIFGMCDRGGQLPSRCSAPSSACACCSRSSPRDLARRRATVWASRTGIWRHRAVLIGEPLGARQSSPARIELAIAVALLELPRKCAILASRAASRAPRRCRALSSTRNRAGSRRNNAGGGHTGLDRLADQPIARRYRMDRLVGQPARPVIGGVNRRGQNAGATTDVHRGETTPLSRRHRRGSRRGAPPRRVSPPPPARLKSCAVPSRPVQRRNRSPSTTARPGRCPGSRTASCA